MPHVASIGTYLPCWRAPQHRAPGGDEDAINQVDGARIALAHNIGGATAVSAVTILEGSAHGAR